ncbi:MAG: DUF4865 family protein [Streptosporangiaceae bacterium]
MIAKQYTINLPADYDMEIIRHRVRDNGKRFDAWPGLGFKAFLMTDRAAGATTNRYAPFYLWNDVGGLNEFLYGEGFSALSQSFGRPQVEHWIGLAAATGSSERARWATRQDLVLPDSDPHDFREAGQAWLRAATADDRGLHAAVVAVDPYRWHTVRFALWCSPGDRTLADHTSYEVLHLSEPGLDFTQ